MKHRAYLLVLASAALLSLTCTAQGPEPVNAPQILVTAAAITPTLTPTPAPTPVPPSKAKMLLMTNEDKVGQMLMLGFTGSSIGDSNLPSLLREMRAGGLVFLAANVSTPAALRDLTESAQVTAFAELHSRLLLAVDQEGGTVLRLGQPFTAFPSAALVGQTCDLDLARRLGKAIGLEMREAGLNMNLAPVLDTSGANPAILSRSFSPDPSVVARFGAAFVDGLHDAGVIATAKHFPGHGGVAADSHLTLPIDRRSEAVLREIDLKPFIELTRRGTRSIDAIMTAHVAYPTLDERILPGTLSPSIVSQLLRSSLGFQGLVISDDLHMDAVTNTYPIGLAAVEAVRAGVDMLMVSGPRSSQEEVRRALLSALQDGTLSESRIDESVERILNLKARFKVGEEETANYDAIGSAEHANLVRETRLKASTAEMCAR